MMGFLNFLKPVADVIKEPLTEWQKRKTISAKAKSRVDLILANAEIAKANAKLEMAKNGQFIEADWDAKALEQMRFSWKDEYLLILFTLPVIGAFIPGIQDYVNTGFLYISRMPEWYRISLIGMIASSFGLRWLMSPLARGKNGNIGSVKKAEQSGSGGKDL